MTALAIVSLALAAGSLVGLFYTHRKYRRTVREVGHARLSAWAYRTVASSSTSRAIALEKRMRAAGVEVPRGLDDDERSADERMMDLCRSFIREPSAERLRKMAYPGPFPADTVEGER